MRGSDNTALRLGPPQRVEAQRRPVMGGRSSGIHLLAQAKEHQVARAVRAETRNLHVIAQDVRILGYVVLLAGEKLLLVIEARAPGEIRADLEILALTVSDHVGGEHALRRIRIVRAPGGMDVMIAGPPAELGGIDPA